MCEIYQIAIKMTQKCQLKSCKESYPQKLWLTISFVFTAKTNNYQHVQEWYGQPQQNCAAFIDLVCFFCLNNDTDVAKINNIKPKMCLQKQQHTSALKPISFVKKIISDFNFGSPYNMKRFNVRQSYCARYSYRLDVLRPSVPHTLVLYRNGSTYRQTVFTAL